MSHLFGWLWSNIKPYIYAKTRAYIVGCAGGVFIWGNYIIAHIHLPENWALELCAKALGVGISGILSGAGTEFGTQKVRKWLGKKKKVEDPTDEIYDDKPKQIWGKNGHDKNGTHH